MLSKVLLATDGSKNALEAARQVGALASALPGLKVTVLYVCPVFIPMGTTGMEPSLVPYVPDEREAKRQGEPVLRKTLQAIGAPAERMETRLTTGMPVEEIVSLAEEGGYDLIVMGRRGVNPLTALLIGSVAERVLGLAPCPVLLVPAAAGARAAG